MDFLLLEGLPQGFFFLVEVWAHLFRNKVLVCPLLSYVSRLFVVVVSGSCVLYSSMLCVCDEACCVHRRRCTKFVVKSWDGGMLNGLVRVVLNSNAVWDVVYK